VNLTGDGNLFSFVPKVDGTKFFTLSTECIILIHFRYFPLVIAGGFQHTKVCLNEIPYVKVIRIQRSIGGMGYWTLIITLLMCCNL
jgi:hypothetical protein